MIIELTREDLIMPIFTYLIGYVLCYPFMFYRMYKESDYSKVKIDKLTRLERFIIFLVTFSVLIPVSLADNLIWFIFAPINVFNSIIDYHSKIIAKGLTK